MAKIKKRGKKITISFDNKRESSNLLRAVGFKNIPALQDEQAVEYTLAVDNAICSACGEPMEYHVGGAKRGLCKNRIANKA